MAGFPCVVLEAGLVESAHQFRGEGGGQLVGDPRREVALRVGVSHVAKLTALARAQGPDRETCRNSVT